MGIFNKIRKAFRKGGALPHEHGPAVKLWVNLTDEEKTARTAQIIADAPKAKTSKAKEQSWEEFKKELSKPASITVEVVKNPGTSATCVCGGGTCGCAKRKEDYAKAVAAKQKRATATKPVAKSQEKRIAIQKDIAEAPLPKKPVSKKTVTEPVAKKAPAKKVTKPVAKEAPKAEPKPAAKKPTPKKK